MLPVYLFYEIVGWQVGRHLWLTYVRQKITPRLRYTVTVRRRAESARNQRYRWWWWWW